MTKKTTTLKCEIDSAMMSITYAECKRGEDDKWQAIHEDQFNFDSLPDNVKEWLALYGLRAALADRTSDAKRLGVNKLAWMREIYDQFANGQIHKPRASVGGVDKAIVQLVVQLKGCDAIAAEKAIKGASKEWRDAIKDKYADELAAIRAELAGVSAVDLTDL